MRSSGVARPGQGPARGVGGELGHRHAVRPPSEVGRGSQLSESCPSRGAPDNHPKWIHRLIVARIAGGREAPWDPLPSTIAAQSCHSGGIGIRALDSTEDKAAATMRTRGETREKATGRGSVGRPENESGEDTGERMVEGRWHPTSRRRESTDQRACEE